MIHEFVVFLSRIAGLIKEDDPEFVLLELDRAYELYTGYDSRFMMSLGCKDLARLIGDRPELLVVAGLIMKEQAVVYRKSESAPEKQTALRLLEKSICLRERTDSETLPPALKEKTATLEADRELLTAWQQSNSC